jgi:CheY-like chemotaxis protein
VAASFEDALSAAVSQRPHLIVVDRDLPRALRLVEDLRREAKTRTISIAVGARGDFSDLELQLLQAGANAIVRLPAGSEWDVRLSDLMRVPARRATRVPVRIEFQGETAAVATVWGAILNLSGTGMLVDVSQTLAMGAELQFRFLIPGERESIQGSGQVVREERAKRYGVHFERLAGSASERILRYVAAASGPARRDRRS